MPRRRSPPRTSAAAIAGLLALTGGLSPVPARGAPATDGLKAAVVYNFSRFAAWPPSRFGAPDSPVVLCVSPREPMAEALDALEGQPVGRRRLEVRRTGAFTRGCHLAYVSDADASADALAALHDRGVLTVGDAPGFSKAGAIGLIQVGRQVRFEINNRAARAAGVELSSQLLRLAVVVR